MVNDLRDLAALLKMCRKFGVNEIALGSVSLKFGEMPSKSSSSQAADADEIPTDELTPEQLMFYAVGGQP